LTLKGHDDEKWSDGQVKDALSKKLPEEGDNISISSQVRVWVRLPFIVTVFISFYLTLTLILTLTLNLTLILTLTLTLTLAIIFNLTLNLNLEF
jgi:hypothetical protein